MKSLHCLALFLSCIALFCLTQSAEVANVTPIIGNSFTGTVPEPELIGYYVYRVAADPSTVQLRITLRGIDIGNVVELQVQGCNLPSVTGNQPVTNNTDLRKCTDYGSGCSVVLPRPCYLYESRLVYISVSSPNGVNFDLTVEEIAVAFNALDNGYIVFNETLLAGEVHRYVFSTPGDFLSVEFGAERPVQFTLSPFPDTREDCNSQTYDSSSTTDFLCPQVFNLSSTWYLSFTEIDGEDNSYNLTTFVGEVEHIELTSGESMNATVPIGGVELFKIPVEVSESTYPLKVELKFESEYETTLFVYASTHEVPFCESSESQPCGSGTTCVVEVASCGEYSYNGNYYIAVVNRNTLNFHDLFTEIDFEITATLVNDSYDGVFEIDGAITIGTGTTDFEVNINETFLAMYPTDELSEESVFVLHAQYTGEVGENLYFQASVGVPGCGNSVNYEYTTGAELGYVFEFAPLYCFPAQYGSNAHIRISADSETTIYGNVTVGYINPIELVEGEPVEGSVSPISEGADSGLEIYSFFIPTTHFALLNVTAIVGAAPVDFADSIKLWAGCDPILPDNTETGSDFILYTIYHNYRNELRCNAGQEYIEVIITGNNAQVNYSIEFTIDSDNNITSLISGQPESDTLPAGANAYFSAEIDVQSVIARVTTNSSDAALVVEPPNCAGQLILCEDGECVYRYLTKDPDMPAGVWRFTVLVDTYSEYEITVTWGTDNCEEVSLNADENWCAGASRLPQNTLQVLSEEFTTVSEADDLAQLQFKAIGVLDASLDCLYALQAYVCMSAFPICDANGFMSSSVEMCNQCAYFFDACASTGICFEYAACESICSAAGVTPQPPESSSSSNDGSDGDGTDGNDIDGADGNSSSASHLTSFLSL